MKKTLFFAAFAAAMAFVACNKELNGNGENLQGNGDVITTLQASLEGCTKTALEADGDDSYNTVWKTGDAITLISNGGSSAEFTLASGANSTSASFSGYLNSTSDPFFAVYPSSLGATKSSGKVNFTLPQIQTGSLDASGGVMPAIAYIPNPTQNVSFMNVCGIFRIKLTGSATIGKLELYDLGGAMLWGNAKLSANSTLEAPATWVWSLEEGDNKLIVDFSGNEPTLTAEQPTMFYFVVPKDALAGGARVVIYDAAGNAIDEFCSGKNLTVARSEVRPMSSITVGNFKLLDLDGSANCYIANRSSASGPYKFCAVTGNDQSAVLSNVNSGVELWESLAQGSEFNSGNTGWLIDDVSYSAGCISFATLSRQGNAVIAAKNSSDEILWSWHIWLPNATPVGTATLGNGKTFLDRNIGAMYDCTNTTATGLLYQWGRKDPFTAPYRIKYGTLMATSPTNIMTDHTSVETIAWTIQNPTSFIYLSSGGKWFSDSAQTWETTNKSIYDPCPPGYRVPSVSQLSGLSFNKLDGDNYWDSANARIQESTGQYFAGTGRRYVSSGNPKVDTAKNGYYWARDNTGNNMTTAFTIAGPTDTEAEKVLVSANNHGKYFGYAVRCVAE